MRTLFYTLLFGALLAPHSAPATDVVPDYELEPRFVGKAANYRFELDDQGISWKTGKTGKKTKRCSGKRRRALLFKVDESPGIGFAQLFPGPNQKRAPTRMDVFIDPTRLNSIGSRAAVELDSPFVPIGGNFQAFVILQVEREADGRLEVATFARNGLPPAAPVGTPIVLPEDTPGIVARIHYENGAVDVEAGPCDAAALTPIVTGQTLPFGGSSGLGVGMGGEKGDGAAFSFAVKGDIHDPATQDVLDDLKAVMDLEAAAIAALAADNPVDAGLRAEEARKLIAEQGPQVPASDPPVYEPSLKAKVMALGLPEPVQEKVLKYLDKAARRDGQAAESLATGRPSAPRFARGALEKAGQEKLRAKAVLETGVVAEGQGKL
jgi:hypothetical protein